MRRWPGGLIRSTPLVPTTASASGVWTVLEQAQARAQGIWPSVIFPISTPVGLGNNLVAGAAATVTMTTTGAIPAGSLALVGVVLNKSTTISVSSVSDGTNSYSRARTSTWSAGAANVVELWYCANAAAVSSSATITVTPSVSTDAGQFSIVCAAYVADGIITTSPLDVANSTAYSPATALSSGSSGTLAQAKEIAIGLVGGYTAAGASTTTEGSGFTQILERQQAGGAQWWLHLAYQIVNATTALNYQPSASVSTYGASIIATFKGTT